MPLVVPVNPPCGQGTDCQRACPLRAGTRWTDPLCAPARQSSLPAGFGVLGLACRCATKRGGIGARCCQSHATTATTPHATMPGKDDDGGMCGLIWLSCYIFINLVRGLRHAGVAWFGAPARAHDIGSMVVWVSRARRAVPGSPHAHAPRAPARRPCPARRHRVGAQTQAHTASALWRPFAGRYRSADPCRALPRRRTRDTHTVDDADEQSDLPRVGLPDVPRTLALVRHLGVQRRTLHTAAVPLAATRGLCRVHGVWVAPRHTADAPAPPRPPIVARLRHAWSGMSRHTLACPACGTCRSRCSHPS